MPSIDCGRTCEHGKAEGDCMACVITHLQRHEAGCATNREGAEWRDTCDCGADDASYQTEK